MKKISCFLLILLTTTMCTSAPKGQKILIETSHGDIKVLLYDDTPLHRDNFIKLVKNAFYDDLTFHRVIKGFMIQAGDANTAKDSTASKFDSESLIEAEFRTPEHFHKAGALAAARWGEEENPEKASSAFQFYIVTGKVIFEHDMRTLEKQRFENLKQAIYQGKQSASMSEIKAMYKSGNRAGIAELKDCILQEANQEAENRKSEVLFTEEQKKTYNTTGGAPHLDGNYTVFGEVYEGMDIVREIEKVDVSAKDKPVRAVVIKRMSFINHD